MNVLCVGQLVADIVVKPVDSLPEPGRTDLVQELRLVAGGCAANTASVLAKLGANTTVVGLTGRDAVGDALLADLLSSGVDVSRVVRNSELRTSSAVVMISSSGERSFFYSTGGNECLSCSMVPDNALKDVDYMHVGGAMKLTGLDLGDLMARAKSWDCITSLDTDWDVSGAWSGRLETALPMIDFLLTNREEGSMLTGLTDPVEICEHLLKQGPKTVVVKLGEMGAVAMWEDGVCESPAFMVPVVDTTCAGDSFAAGFLLGLSRGWTIPDSLQFANAAGALCTTDLSHYGVVSYESTVEFLHRNDKATSREPTQVD